MCFCARPFHPFRVLPSLVRVVASRGASLRPLCLLIAADRPAFRVPRARYRSMDHLSIRASWRPLGIALSCAVGLAVQQCVAPSEVTGSLIQLWVFGLLEALPKTPQESPGTHGSSWLQVGLSWFKFCILYPPVRKGKLRQCRVRCKPKL